MNDYYHGGTGGLTTVDLRDADNPAVGNGLNPNDAGSVFKYDKSAMPAAAANWGSADATWAAETAANLDPFCLTCHDVDGASVAWQLGDTGASAGNPFADAAIANEYDQYDRGAVVDVASMMSVTDGIDRDQAGELRGPDGIPDPPNGIYSRHAIRGQSQSIYSTYTGLGGTDSSMYDYLFGGSTRAMVQTGASDAQGPLWNDTSVMGCADCHTTDGANGDAGNAHGADSEYLLKDAAGGATEGTYAGTSYVCWRCHASAMYFGGTGHTGNAGDYQDKTALLGTARVSDGKGSNRFGIACINCHGGGEFGGIHGTSTTFATGEDGGAGTRQAYRFTNGASLRFYDPLGWTGTGATCFTLSTADAWGGCTQHNRGTSRTKLFSRPLSY